MRPRDSTLHLAYQQWRQPLRGLVHQQQVGIGHERTPSGNVLALEAHLTLAWGREADDRADEGGLAHAVASQEAHDLPLPYVPGDPLQDIAVAIVGVDVVQVQHHSPPR